MTSLECYYFYYNHAELCQLIGFGFYVITFNNFSVNYHTCPGQASQWFTTGLDKQKFQHKIVNIFLPINFNICFGCSKNRLIETVLLSTHNICFGLEIRKLNFRYALLTKVLVN